MQFDIEPIPGIEGCVFKLWYAECYIIVKSKTMHRGIMSIKSDLTYFFKGTKGGQNEKHLYLDFYAHIEAHPFEKFSIDLILSSNNPLELLKCEQIELEKGYDDPRCLNKHFDAYIPDNTQINGKKSWINRGYYLNFMQWKKKRANQNKTV